MNQRITDSLRLQLALSRTNNRTYLVSVTTWVKPNSEEQAILDQYGASGHGKFYTACLTRADIYDLANHRWIRVIGTGVLRAA